MARSPSHISPSRDVMLPVASERICEKAPANCHPARIIKINQSLHEIQTSKCNTENAGGHKAENAFSANRHNRQKWASPPFGFVFLSSLRSGKQIENNTRRLLLLPGESESTISIDRIFFGEHVTGGRMSPLRWGIAGAGTISHDFVYALSTLPESDHKVVANAARGLENAEKFADLHGIPVCYVGYEALAKDPHVDIVYIGTVSSIHYELAMMMLDAGKHVLCEKPLCVNEGQAKALLEYAREKELFCMEAIRSRFFPSYSHLRERIRKGDLGAIQEMTVELGFPISNVERIRSQHLGGGTVLDLGVYNIQLALMVFQEFPDEIDADGELNEENVDIETNVQLHFPSGGVAMMRTSGVQNLSNKAVIVGSAGSIMLPDFWCPTELTDIDGTIRSYPLPNSKIECIQKNSVGLRYAAEECRKRLLAGDLESAVVSHSDSLAVARVQDAIRKKVGVEIAEDYIFKP